MNVRFVKERPSSFRHYFLAGSFHGGLTPRQLHGGIMKSVFALLVFSLSLGSFALAEPGKFDPGASDGEFYCLGGYLYGPNGLKEWSGDTSACENPDKYVGGRRFACFMGSLYGRNGLRKWSGDSNACGNRDKLLIGGRYACFMGYLLGPNGLEKWSGDSNVCGNSNRVKFGRQVVCFNGYLLDRDGDEQWTSDSDYCGKHAIP